jgi:hypothetical protein
MVATTDKKAAAKPAKGKEGSKKLPAVPESVLKHRKRREALRARRLQVNSIIIIIDCPVGLIMKFYHSHVPHILSCGCLKDD